MMKYNSVKWPANHSDYLEW